MPRDRWTATWLLRCLFIAACLASGIGLGLWMRSLYADPYAAARAEFESLAPSQQREVLRNYEHFSQLSPTEKEQLRGLHEQLDSADDAETLVVIRDSFTEWVKSLSPTQRAELTALTSQTTARIERVEMYLREQLRRAPLTDEDIQKVVAWIDEIVARNLDTESRLALDDLQDRGERQRRLLWFASQRLQERMGGTRSIPLSNDDVKRLAESLSPQARQRLADAETLPDKRREILGWIFVAMRKLHGSLRYGESAEIREEDLVQFFEKKLDDAKREELLSLPPAERIERLRAYYLRDKYPDRPFGPPSFGRPPGVPFGSGGPRFEGGRPGSGPGSGPPSEHNRNGRGPDDRNDADRNDPERKDPERKDPSRKGPPPGGPRPVPSRD